MSFKQKKNELFYSKEWDTILNSLIKYFPFNLPFNLYDISQKENIKYDDLLTDSASNVEQTYVDITNHLIYNDFTRLNDFRNIILTDKGRQLIQNGSYKKFAQIERLRQKAEIRDLWVKRHWFWVEFLKVILSIGVGALLTLGIQNFTNFTEPKPNQKENLQLPKSDTVQKNKPRTHNNRSAARLADE
jgi:hypothetical protein